MALGLLGDMVERREEDIGNADLLGHVGHVLALRVFDVAVAGLPVVGDEEHGVGACEGSCQEINGVQVGLDLVSYSNGRGRTRQGNISTQPRHPAWPGLGGLL